MIWSCDKIPPINLWSLPYRGYDSPMLCYNVTSTKKRAYPAHLIQSLMASR